jgi:aconitate hydratase
VEESKLFQFENNSTYIQKPPFFERFGKDLKPMKALSDLKVLALFGDSITTDHISPAGNIGLGTPAAKYLQERGVEQKDFNTYGSRRGNHEVMMRGTFANIRIKNKIVPEIEGGYTIHWPTNQICSIFDASMEYQKNDTGLVIVAGKDYGMGSSRDWAAKGTALLGVRAVLAESFERIHRSNLVMMGIMPLQFENEQSAAGLGLTGEETFEILLKDFLSTKESVKVKAVRGDIEIEFNAILRFDSAIEVEYYRNGGILPMVLRNKLAEITRKTKS